MNASRCQRHVRTVFSDNSVAVEVEFEVRSACHLEPAYRFFAATVSPKAVRLTYADRRTERWDLDRGDGDDSASSAAAEALR